MKCSASDRDCSAARRASVVVLGAGASGKAAARLAAGLGFAVRMLEGDDELSADEPAVLAVVSPGIPLTHRWIGACLERGIRVVSELQFGVEECRRRGIRLLAVTGSKGKSSVVKAVADGLCRAGFAAVPCGNYGKPVCEVAIERSAAWAVVEVSSFQMETTALAADTFEAAAVLNLQEDHIDRHGSVKAYHELKMRLLSMARCGMPPPSADEARSAAALAAGSYFGNEILAGNAACAAFLMRAAGLSDAQIAGAFREFRPLPHRMECVGVFGGIRCIDDSKATSIEALAAGLTMAGSRILLVAGGLAKGDDPSKAISPLTERVKKVYLIGRCAEVFRDAWSGAVDCEVCGTMERAVASAMGDAVRGDVLLLSPGAASFDQFENFGRRGEVFAELAKREGLKKK